MTTETIPASAPETVPFEPTTPIKPSEAIRLGCLKYPVQGFGDTIKGNAACALGAMLGGFGWDDEGDESSWCDPRLDRFFTDDKRCPACEMLTDSSYLVAHLNDRHGRDDGWTRERIADWLGGLGL